MTALKTSPTGTLESQRSGITGPTIGERNDQRGRGGMHAAHSGPFIENENPMDMGPSLEVNDKGRRMYGELVGAFLERF